MNVYEDEGTICKLKILKHGTNEHDVTVDIQLDVANDIYEAQYGNIYIMYNKLPQCIVVIYIIYNRC